MDSHKVEQGKNLKDGEIFSVSRYIEILNAKIEVLHAKIIGEVSEVKIGPTGHIYFSLKDEKDKSVIHCIIWKSAYKLYNIELKEGLKIIASGSPNIYPATGRLSFIAKVIEHAGEGALKKEYDKLKKKLADEGFFLEEKKRRIPAYAQRVGVITSLSGAVMADFSNNLGKFGFKVKMIDSRVEGQAAVADLLSSIRTFRNLDIEALVIMRGGGSLESIMAFNNELLVREVANFPFPVIAAIGHHKNMPLVALAADLAVSTPSIAATALTKSWEQANLFLERHQRGIIGGYEDVLENAHGLIDKGIETIREYIDLILNKYEEIKNGLKVSLQNFKNSLLNVRVILRNSWNKSSSGFKSSLSIVSQQLEYAERIANLNNPERQLKLGYSIVRCNGRIVKSVKNTRVGDDVDIRVIDGMIISRVKKINKINKNKNG